MIARSIKMALKKIHEMCEEKRTRIICPFNSEKYGCFFGSRMPEDWDFDMLKEEKE